jgi:hypothetical protein
MLLDVRPRQQPRHRIVIAFSRPPTLAAASEISRTQRYGTGLRSNPSRASCPAPDHCAAPRSEIAVSGTADFASRLQNSLT